MDNILTNTLTHGFVICPPAGIAPPGDFEEEELADPNGEILALEAKMVPLLMDTMTKSKDGFLGVRQGHTLNPY